MKLRKFQVAQRIVIYYLPKPERSLVYHPECAEGFPQLAIVKKDPRLK